MFRKPYQVRNLKHFSASKYILPIPYFWNVYSFNKYVGRTDEVVTSMKGIFPALKFFCCGVILQSGTETVTPEKFLRQN